MQGLNQTFPWLLDVVPKLVQEITGSILLQGLRGGAGGGEKEREEEGEEKGEGERGEGNRNKKLKFSIQENIDLSRIQHSECPTPSQ